MKITTVTIDIASAGVTVGFEDGTSQIVTAPLAPAMQGVSLEDIQKVETDESAVAADLKTDEAKVEPAVEAPVDTSATI